MQVNVDTKDVEVTLKAAIVQALAAHSEAFIEQIVAKSLFSSGRGSPQLDEFIKDGIRDLAVQEVKVWLTDNSESIKKQLRAVIETRMLAQDEIVNAIDYALKEVRLPSLKLFGKKKSTIEEEEDDE